MKTFEEREERNRSREMGERSCYHVPQLDLKFSIVSLIRKALQGCGEHPPVSCGILLLRKVSNGWIDLLNCHVVDKFPNHKVLELATFYKYYIQTSFLHRISADLSNI